MSLRFRRCASAWLAVFVVALAATMRPAWAFGGLWSSRSDDPVRPTAEQVLFVDNHDGTITAVVRIHFRGSAQKFAWLIPVPGKPIVGVSSNVVFQRLDAATSPEYWLEVGVDGRCAGSDARDAGPSPAAVSVGRTDAAHDAATQGVGIDRSSIGPYDYVDLEVDRSLPDPTRTVTAWLSANGYATTGLEDRVLGPYLKDGYHLLAFKLADGMDAVAVRPVTLTYDAKLPTIPLRPMFASARDATDVEVWVVGPTQAVPRNYRSLVLDDARIDWLGGARFPTGTLPAGGVGPFGPHVDKPDNYDAVAAEAAREAGGQGFVTELAGPASQYRDKVWSSLDDDGFEAMARAPHADGVDAVVAAKARFGEWDGWKEAVQGATTASAPVTIDAFASEPGRFRGAVTVDTAKFWSLLRRGVVKPVADTARMLYRAPYLTRFSTALRADDMTVDPVFDYDFDLAQVERVHIAKQVVECSPTRALRDAPWRVLLPQGGAVAGSGGAAWPVGSSLPANLMVVASSTSGAGTIVRDNRDAIGAQLPALPDAGAYLAMPHPPQNGLPIGARAVVTPSGPMPSAGRPASAWACDRCSVAAADGRSSSTAFARWVPLTLLALRRRRASRGPRAS